MFQQNDEAKIKKRILQPYYFLYGIQGLNIAFERFKNMINLFNSSNLFLTKSQIFGPMGS